MNYIELKNYVEVGFMKFEEQESIDDSSKETVLKPEIEENEAFEKIEPMLDYGNIKSSKDIEFLHY